MGLNERNEGGAGDEPGRGMPGGGDGFGAAGEGGGAGELAAAGGDEVVRGRRFCVRCGYLLLGVARRGVCPECGVPVALSLRQTLLTDAPRETLQRMARGLALVQVTMVLTVMSFGGGCVSGYGLALTNMAPAGAMLWAGFGLLIAGLSFTGHWWYTEVDEGAVVTRRARAGRNAVRGATVGIAVLQVIKPAMDALFLPVAAGPTTNGSRAFLIAWVLACFAWYVMTAVRVFGMVEFTRWMAGRAQDRKLVERTRRYLWLLPLLGLAPCPVTAATVPLAAGCGLVFMAPVLAAVVLYWRMLGRIRGHVVSVLRTGAVVEYGVEG